jgi:hypothetical protein
VGRLLQHADDDDHDARAEHGLDPVDRGGGIRDSRDGPWYSEQHEALKQHECRARQHEHSQCSAQALLAHPERQVANTLEQNPSQQQHGGHA